MQYDYFYGAQAEQFAFYRMSKALFTDKKFSELSTDAKVLYKVINHSDYANGSDNLYTKSYQALGRELMTPEEIRTMPRNWCLLIISGVAPFYSRKYNLKDHPNYHLVEENGGKPFDYDRRAQMSFKAFLQDVKEVKTMQIDGKDGDE